MRNYVFAIGIDKYQSCQNLANCKRDLEKILEILIEKYGFKKDDIFTLFDDKATQSSIINQLEFFLDELSLTDNLLIFYSGHGEYDENLEVGYVIPTEAEAFNKATYIPNSTIYNYFRSLKSHHLLLISDSCFSGSFFQTRDIPKTGKDRLDNISSKWAITSGRVEPVLDGNPNSHSPFAEALIQILENNTDGLMSVSELTGKIISEVAGKVSQIPRGEPLQSLGHKGGEFIFRISSDKSITPEIKIEIDNYSELKKIIQSYYEVSLKIEQAENESKTATVKRLKEELGHIKNLINGEIIKELEIGKTNLIKSENIEQIFGRDFSDKYFELKEINKQKNEIVKQQKFEEAARLRDKARKIEDELVLKVDLKEKLQLSEESIVNDYSILSIFIDLALYQVRELAKQSVENIFSNLLFLSISKKTNNISAYKFQDIITTYKTQELLKLIKLLTNRDQEIELTERKHYTSFLTSAREFLGKYF